MTKLSIFILAVSVLTTSCNNVEQKNNRSANDTAMTKTALINHVENKFETTEIDCDSVYKNKDYTITLTPFDTTIWDYDTIPNSVFVVHRNFNGQKIKLFSDSIHIMLQYKYVKFSDFNGDNLKDILIQNISDVRSNPTYYLYLVDTTHDKLTKIKGFEEIKNPNYVSEHNLIDNYVLSGQTWTSFYKIQDNTIKDYDIVIYDNHTDDSTYDRDYQNAIKKILKKEKNNR